MISYSRAHLPNGGEPLRSIPNSWLLPLLLFYFALPDLLSTRNLALFDLVAASAPSVVALEVLVQRPVPLLPLCRSIHRPFHRS